MEKTIRLQRVGEYLYPTDAVSVEYLGEEMELGRIPVERDFAIFPALVARGFKLAITNY